MRLLPICLLAVSVGCGAEAPTPAPEAADDVSSAELHRRPPNPNPMLYPKDARPYGRSVERWSELLWSYIYAQPFDQSPFLDTTGEHCAVGQEGPVWFLPAVPGSTLGTTVTRHCTLPRNRSVILQLASAMNDFPCPDPNFKPAPGQSLFDFLIAPISPLFDGETGFTVTLDGVAIQDPLSYRFTSDDVFLFKGDLSLQSTFDSCVTGRWQFGASDGFYLMFKPLSPGRHTIIVNGHDMEGVAVTLTENLTVR